MFPCVRIRRATLKAKRGVLGFGVRVMGRVRVDKVRVVTVMVAVMVVVMVAVMVSVMVSVMVAVMVAGVVLAHER